MKKAVALALVASLAAACGDEHPSSEGEAPEDTSMRGAFGLPDEFTLPGGQRMRRVDLWDPAELDQVIEAGAVTDPETPEELAEALRSHTLTSEGGYYIQVEPDLEQARRALESQAHLLENGMNSEAQAKRIRSPTDERSGYQAPPPGILAALGLNESGGTLNLIDAQTAITAAHIVYATGSNRWICRNGTLDDGSGAVCTESGEPGISRHRYGVFGSTGSGPWTGCYTVSVPNAYVALTNSSTTDALAANDFAVVTYCNPVPHDGWLFSFHVATDAEVEDHPVWNFGYPAYAPCGPGDSGGLVNTDCTEGSWQFVNGWMPLGGGTLWGSVWYAGAAWPGNPGNIHSIVDTTVGHSGSGLFYVNSQGGVNVIGVLHGGLTTEYYNRFHRITTTDAWFGLAHVLNNGTETFHR